MNETTPRLPRLLAGVRSQDALTLADHERIHGPLNVRVGRDGDEGLIAEVEHAGLLGQGGAGFPTAVKLRAVAAARGRPIIVANGSEGEPASAKDRVLLEKLPHLVLDGAQAAAAAVGGGRIVVAVPTDGGPEQALRQALRERAAARLPELGVEIAPVPDRYVAGQESALVNLLNGRAAKPSQAPPLPFERGVQGRPTLINNVETLAQLALIARYGGDWFRELGPPAQPGSTLVSLSGCVARPGVYEIEHGMSLADLVAGAGGQTTAVRAALLGGYFGSWVGPEALPQLRLSADGLAPHGAALGAGVVVLLPDSACPVNECARVGRWFAQQSAGQCGPCINGLDAIAGALEELAWGTAAPATKARLARWAAMVERRGACAHPDGAARFVRSTLEVFAHELAEHAQHGPCEACERESLLPVPLRSRRLAMSRLAA